MNEFENKLLEEVLAKTQYYNNDFSLDKLTHMDAHKCVYDFLNTIVEYFGCNDYTFVIAITKFEEKHGKFVLPYLFEILDNYCNYPNMFSDDVAFAAYYNIGLHYYRYYQLNELYDFITKCPYLEIFRKKYPMAYDSIGRYCNMNGMFDRMFIFNQAVISNMQKLKKEKPEYFGVTKHGYIQTGNNVAIKVGIIAAACAMLEQAFIRGTLNKGIKADDDNRFSLDHIEGLPTERVNALIKIQDNYKCDESLINEDMLSLVMEYTIEAIEYNPKYPKYPFLKGQLLFYTAIYNMQEINFELFNEIKALLNKAKDLENSKANDYELRTAKYADFLKRVEDYMENSGQASKMDLEYYRQKAEIIQMQVCPPPQKRMKPTAISGDDYAFISYSTLDFKSVYCDLLALKNRGISFWYDAGVVAGEEWQKTIEEKLIGASCIICFLSANFLRSGAIYRELSLFKKYNKPIIWVDLTGNKQISKILLSVMRDSDISLAKDISSNMINIITELVNDDVTMISRDKDPQAEAHISRVESVILEKFSAIVKSVTSEALTIRNQKKDLNDKKTIPNEDYVINDAANSVYVVMDGISRKKEEYRSDGSSIAYDVSKLFADAIHEYITKNVNKCKDFKDARSMLLQGFNIANSKVDDMLKSRKEEYKGYEYPGSVGIVAFIINRMLVYGSLGDCMGILARNHHKQIFSPKQTTYAFDYLKHERNRELLAKEYINNPECPHGYGVVNGDPRAINYFNISYINLDRADTVYLVSDGVSDFIEFNKNDYINSLSLEQIIEESTKQDIMLNKSYIDDKTIVRIKVDVNKEY